MLIWQNVFPVILGNCQKYEFSHSKIAQIDSRKIKVTNCGNFRENDISNYEIELLNCWFHGKEYRWRYICNCIIFPHCDLGGSLLHASPKDILYPTNLKDILRPLGLEVGGSRFQLQTCTKPENEIFIANNYS